MYIFIYIYVYIPILPHSCCWFVTGDFWILQQKEAAGPTAGQWRAGALRGQFSHLCGASFIGQACGMCYMYRYICIDI